MTVFADERVHRALDDFIPVVQNCAYTQNHGKNDETNQFFREVIQKGENFRHQNLPDFSYETLFPFKYNAQGMYTFNSEGTPYGGRNEQNPESVLRLLADAKRAFDANPPKTRYRPSRTDNPKPRPPSGTVIAKTITRIRPVPSGASERNQFVGRDYFWILEHEVRALTHGAFPPDLAARIARYHLVDNVRGAPDPWQSQQVHRANFQARPQVQGDNLRINITGEFSLLAPAGRSTSTHLEETGYQGTLEGYLIVRQDDGTVLDLQWLAEGDHWGRSHHNPNEPSGKFPLKVAFVLAKDKFAPEIPPNGAIFRDYYLHPAP